MEIKLLAEDVEDAKKRALRGEGYLMDQRQEVEFKEFNEVAETTHPGGDLGAEVVREAEENYQP